MLNSVFAFVRVLIFLLALGTQSVAIAQSVNVEFDESVDFTKYKTFVIRDGVMNAKSPALNNSLTKKRIQTEIEKALIAKGLSLTTDQADLEVFFQFGTARVLEQKTFAARNGTHVINTP